MPRGLSVAAMLRFIPAARYETRFGSDKMGSSPETPTRPANELACSGVPEPMT